jgi:hypothetical protein
VEGRAAGDVVSLDNRGLDADSVVGRHAKSDAGEGDALGAYERLATQLRKHGKGEADQHREQTAEHVQLGVEVDDHRAGVSAPVEEIVHGGKRLNRSLKRSDGERRAARKNESPRRCSRTSIRASDEPEQQPEAGEHGDSGTHQQERMNRRRLLCLLGGEAAADD